MSKYKGAWPPPVYVATFANGEVCRASFQSPYGKPLDFAAGRRMACHFARNWERYSYGYVEFDGQEFPDPMDAKTVKPKMSEAEKLIAAMRKLSVADRRTVLCEFAEVR